MLGAERAVLLLLNGELPEPGRVKRLARRARRVLCADGGARHARSLGLKPDLVVGDMDSLPRPLPPWTKTRYLCDFDENRSDLEKALGVARRMGAREVLVAGASGGRLDHALVNLAVLERAHPALAVTCLAGGWARRLTPGRYRLACRKGQRLTLLAITPRALLRSSGLRYPAPRVLERGGRGLGNRALGEVSLVLERGSLWVLSERELEVSRRGRSRPGLDKV